MKKPTFGEEVCGAIGKLLPLQERPDGSMFVLDTDNSFNKLCADIVDMFDKELYCREDEAELVILRAKILQHTEDEIRVAQRFVIRVLIYKLKCATRK